MEEYSVTIGPLPCRGGPGNLCLRHRKVSIRDCGARTQVCRSARELWARDYRFHLNSQTLWSCKWGGGQQKRIAREMQGAQANMRCAWPPSSIRIGFLPLRIRLACARR